MNNSLDKILNQLDLLNLSYLKVDFINFYNQNEYFLPKNNYILLKKQNIIKGMIMQLVNGNSHTFYYILRFIQLRRCRENSV